MGMNGIDISSHQAGINLEIVPCDFVIIKATEGTEYVNPDCDRAYQQAKRAGKALGVYHYASGLNPTIEADYFLSHIKGYLGNTVLALDWESYGNPSFGVNDFLWCKTWLDHIYKKTGIRPLLYISQSIMGRFEGIGDYGLWIAQYASMDTTGYQESPWNEESYSCAIRQYSSKGRLNGYNGDLDLNKFYGDLSVWNQYARQMTSSSSPQEPANMEETSAINANIIFTYGVQLEDGTILPFVTNLNDFAGIRGKRIANVAIKVDKGSVKYRVHVLGEGWLSYVTGCNWNDAVNGYAGNGKVVDAIEVYYYTPDDIVKKYGYQQAQYRVSPVNGTYYSWQYDNDTINGLDGYAGYFGASIDRLQLF